MAAQPLNTSISIYRTVRSKREAVRHESIAAITKRLRPLIMVVPGEEDLVEVKTRDTSVADFSPYMGEARHDASRGFPIVIGLKDTVTFTSALSIADTDFFLQVGADRFITNTADGLDGDLFGDLAAL